MSVYAMTSLVRAIPLVCMLIFHLCSHRDRIHRRFWELTFCLSLFSGFALNFMPRDEVAWPPAMQQIEDDSPVRQSEPAFFNADGPRFQSVPNTVAVQF